MFARHCLNGVTLFSLGLAIAGCANAGLDSVQVTPSTQALTVGQTAQFTAVGIYGNARHPTTRSITNTVRWSSNTPSVATISSTGVATAVGSGTATITAQGNGYNGTTSSSATLTVTGAGGGAAGGNLLSLTIIPSSIAVGNLQDTGQFLAIGTFSTSPTVRDLTNSPTVTWISATPSVFPVNTDTNGTLGATAGIVTAYGNGSGEITAEATSSDGTIQTATATFSCPLILPTATTAGSCYPGSQAPALLATLTVYNEGLNTTNWQVTAPSATDTPNVLHCGPGWTAANGTPSVCTATYPVGSIVTLTAPAQAAAFGGWSYNCLDPKPITASGPNQCTVILSTNDTVGVIFN